MKGGYNYRLSQCHTFCSRYMDHTITAISVVKGSSQLTLHLQSPAAAAAAQQAAEAAAAAVEADTTLWHEHQVRCGCQCGVTLPMLLRSSSRAM
jgi:hypothetical protein